MILNYIWVGFFLIAFVVGLVKMIFFQDVSVFPAMLQSTFESAKTGFTISISLTGVMAMWLGIMRIGEQGGIVRILSRIIGPFFSRLFPEVPRDHPAAGSIMMNFSANILGLDNASTPLGLKAMEELQSLNPHKDTASNAQIMFLVLNTSGMTVIPLSIIADRVTLGSADPTSIFIPTLLSTCCAAMAGLIYMSFKQRIRVFDPVFLSYLFAIIAAIGSALYYFSHLTQEELRAQSSLASSVIIITIIIGFIVLGLVKKLPLFTTFTDGAKEGFNTSVKIIPNLVAILVGIGVFRASGAMDYLTDGIGYLVAWFGGDTDFVDALPVALMKPLSSSGSRAMMLAISDSPDKGGFGPDSFAANLASMFRGCADTTFYIVAVYFGSVQVRNTRYAVTGGLIADFAGIIAAIFIAYWWFR